MMRRTTRNLLLPALVAVAAACTGCQQEWTTPLGKGATGRLAVEEIQAEPQMRLGLVNRLVSTKDQAAYDWLHQPFDEATEPGFVPEEERIVLENVQAAWPHMEFVDVEQGKRVRWTIFFETNEGMLNLGLYDATFPNHVRSLLSLARVGFFANKKWRLEGDALEIGGTDAEKDYYYIPTKLDAEYPVEAGAVYLPLVDGRTQGTLFRIALQDQPEMVGKAVVLGKIVLYEAEQKKALADVVASLKQEEGSVRNLNVYLGTPTQQGDLFNPDGTVELPEPPAWYRNEWLRQHNAEQP